MMRIVYFIFLLLLIGGTAHSAASAPLQQEIATNNSIFRAVTLGAEAVAPGAVQSMHVDLDVPPSKLTLLILNIDYPSGETDTVVKSTYEPSTTLTWTVPSAAGVGVVTYQLADSCGCQNKWIGGVPQMPPPSLFTGSFTID